jgi:hypothetical protein
MTTSNLVKLETDHKIRLSLFRHRGDAFATAKELGIDVSYVQKVCSKVKKKTDRNVSYWLASSIMQTVYEGYLQRIGHLQKWLVLAEGQEQLEVSWCHNEPVYREQPRRSVIYTCSKCKKPCYVRLVPAAIAYQLHQKIIMQLREEDRALIDFAEKMGFTDKEEVPMVRQNVLVVNDKAVELDPGVTKDLVRLTPRERERTRKKLENVILQSAETNGRS